MKQKNASTDELTASGFRIIALLYWCGVSLFSAPKLFAGLGQPDISMFQRGWSLFLGILAIVLAVIAIVPPRLITRSKAVFSVCFTLALLPIAFAPFRLVLILRTSVLQGLTVANAIRALIVFIIYCTVIQSLPWYLRFHRRRMRIRGYPNNRLQHTPKGARTHPPGVTSWFPFVTLVLPVPNTFFPANLREWERPLFYAAPGRR